MFFLRLSAEYHLGSQFGKSQGDLTKTIIPDRLTWNFELHEAHVIGEVEKRKKTITVLETRIERLQTLIDADKRSRSEAKEKAKEAAKKRKKNRLVGDWVGPGDKNKKVFLDP